MNAQKLSGLRVKLLKEFKKIFSDNSIISGYGISDEIFQGKCYYISYKVFGVRVYFKANDLKIFF